MRAEERGFLSILYDFFRSLKLTISLLIMLAILSIIGTLITQNATRSEYIERYGTGLYEVLNFFNLFDMYHSWWFKAILVFLMVNLITCSIHRFPGVWRQIFYGSGLKALEDSVLKALPYVERVWVSNLKEFRREDEIRSSLKKCFKNPRRVEVESAITLYSEKGKFSRLGVYITHLSLLFILIGGLLGSLYGFRGFVNILEGEAIDQVYLRIKDEEVERPIGFFVRCEDFNVTYYDLQRPEKHVKEYTSVLTILDNGKEVLKKTVQVNHPLHYKGLAFYQSSYGTIHEATIGIQWKGKKEKTSFKAIEGTTIHVPDSNSHIQLLKYAPQVHNFGEGVQVALFKPNQEPRAFWLLKGFPKFDEKRGDEFILSLGDVVEKEYTGLQVTKDPGVWVVWVGCGLMIFGLIVSFFFSHQRVWVRIPKTPKGEIVVAGSVNKNRMGFEKNFGELVEKIKSIR